MPFTISHIAAVLPFRRFLARFHLLSAAIIGSMVPDFGWLTPWRPARFETHSTVSLLTFSLPVGMATFWIFQRWMQEPLLELLPDGARSRRTGVRADLRDPLQWAYAALGVLVGAITHLVWDAFTHEGARGLRLIPSLDDPTVVIGGHHLVGARLLQDVSSVIGLLVVIGLCAYELRPQRAVAVRVERRLSSTERQLWCTGYVLLAALVSGALFLADHPDTARGLSIPLSRAAIAVLRGMAIALLITAFAVARRLRSLEVRSERRPRP
ncbi:MAG TPA: DUF4184 family protein [Steroidobacteraceae bacterium]|nr:DUF4184 family protein [Steroidobacteraceae bacterium]